MCNLYSLNKKRDAIARFFRVSHNRTVAFEPVRAIFPRHLAPVVRCAADGELFETLHKCYRRREGLVWWGRRLRVVRGNL